MPSGLKRISFRLAALAGKGIDGGLVGPLLEGLDSRYGLASKAEAEPELEEIVLELCSRLARAFGSLGAVKGRRILDLACGSATSRAPGRGRGASALFEPWLCRILLEIGAAPVGIDIGELSAEDFEGYELDLALAGALDFLPPASFDAVHDSRLFGSPEFASRFRDRRRIFAIASELWRQELRLLRPSGIVINSDARLLALGRE